MVKELTLIYYTASGREVANIPSSAAQAVVASTKTKEANMGPCNL